MYKLYGTNLTGTCAIQAALAELSVPFERIEVSTKEGQHLTEDYKKINPRQQVPALVLPDGLVVTEGPAILNHLADAHPEARLAPPPGTPQRSQVTRWLVYFSVNVYEGELRKLFGRRYTTDPNGGEAVEAAADAYVKRHYHIFEAELGGGPYFLESSFSILDIYVWMLAQWIDQNWIESNCPKILRLADTVKARPKIAPIHDLNFG